MLIQKLAFSNLRNLDDVALAPDEGFNIFWGNNAQGKTNLLEGIYVLGNLKSFRSNRIEQLIRQGSKKAELAAELRVGGGRRKVELSILPDGKKARIDGKRIASARHFLQHLRPVLFSPEEVAVVKGAPSGRRSLLDRAVFQADPAYMDRAQEYARHLKQRNSLIKDGRGSDEIIPWTEGLIRTGARIRRDRLDYLANLVPLLEEAHSRIAGGREKAELLYPGSEKSEEELAEELRREIVKNRDRERRLGQTLCGPHRDDPAFLVNGRPLRLYGSQGQQRSFILAFKTAQIMDLEKRTGQSPVLLLDDMTSELDSHRQKFFFSFLLSRKGQVFITTTDIKPLIREGFGRARFYRVEDGAVSEDRRE